MSSNSFSYDVGLANARLSYLEAWAAELERKVALSKSLNNSRKYYADEPARTRMQEQAKALRDQVEFCRNLLGITHTPIDIRPTMEIRDELDARRSRT